MLAALKPVGFETFNIGWDWPVTVTTLIEMIETAVGRKAIIEQHAVNRADVIASWANIAKARRVLNWEPRVTLIRGLQETVNWYMENRELVDSLDLSMGRVEKPVSHGSTDSFGKAAA